MKRIFLLMIWCFISLVSFAGDGEVVEVPMTNTGGHGKQQITVPVVTYLTQANELTVAFDAAESYALQIKDSSGATQYVTTIVTDGNEYSYPVNLAPHSFYVITIYSTNNTFSGVLFTP